VIFTKFRIGFIVIVFQFIPKLIDYLIRFIFSCWLPHAVRSGENLILGYGGLGVVIHGNAVLGADVHIDQNVTIGGNGTECGVPIIENNVYTGAGAKILGPITIGDGSIVGANSVVIRDVPPRTVVAGIPAKIIRQNIDINVFLYYTRTNSSDE
jgi:serine O-acetyltransferase